ncbi:myelin-oligodendrocyte glycoprotein-like isoform X2 [Phascolarctos cinereus]|uniref:Myelin-oligodendrocyte glycoprotein-like isoform X2 n=1 Tax=Phascolarctos cinereus TaxID=38626 RepID=A0A6P5KYH1_PHACI|nr:myelin-oligodendrocyte glycoprotein-like isoform X2 [Phascolarctos cinereus]
MELIGLSCHLFSFLVPILFLEIPTLASGKFSVIGPTGPIQASVGEVAELPCYLSPTQSAEHMGVVWFQSTRVVHLYQDGEDQFGDQDPNYQGRTELVRDSISSGNVTLKIRDMRFLDEGSYKCHFENGFNQDEADVMLKVSEYLIRNSPWLWEISGILVVSWAFEIGIAMYFLWILLRCQGLCCCQNQRLLLGSERSPKPSPQSSVDPMAGCGITQAALEDGL